MPFLRTREFCISLGAGLLLASGCAGSPAQITAEEKPKLAREIRCAIQTERQQWNRATEAVVTGTIENLTDGPLDLKVDPVLYLSSKTSTELRGKFWAPADLLRDKPIETKKLALDSGGEAEGIEPQPLPLQFKNRGDTIHFRIDARHLFWAKTISSVWPSSGLFSTVKSDDYALQLVLETDDGRVESPIVNISIDASKPLDKPQSSAPDPQKAEANPTQETGTPQSIARDMFPNAPEKARSVDCFRALKPEMSIYTVVQKCGRPDEEVGSGIYIFVWHLVNGSTVSIGTPTLQRIYQVRYTDQSGETHLLLH
ncbi:MAG TPA: hypothetical protein VG033_08555 [Candidatus Acidoferrales bacterium]|nr:hypothetical protein [Candidatus Acidoferrales bacterium]